MAFEFNKKLNCPQCCMWKQEFCIGPVHIPPPPLPPATPFINHLKLFFFYLEMAFGALSEVAWNGGADDLFVQPSKLQFYSSRNLFMEYSDSWGFFLLF